MKNLDKREQIDVKDLRERIDELLSRVESGRTFVINKQGKPIAQLVPLNETTTDEAQSHHKQDVEQWFADMDQLAKEIGKRWPKGVSSVDAVRDVRRDL